MLDARMKPEGNAGFGSFIKRVLGFKITQEFETEILGRLRGLPGIAHLGGQMAFALYR